MGRVAALRLQHRHFRTPLWRYVLGGDARTVITAPLIYALLIPFVLLDASVALYQAICFPVWGVPRVPRRAYFAMDRHRLGYLNGLEKLNCLYCSYVNGLNSYVREVAARTEQYWCPIRHSRRVRDPHDRYDGFVPYGDAPAYRRGLPAMRAQLKK